MQGHTKKTKKKRQTKKKDKQILKTQKDKKAPSQLFEKTSIIKMSQPLISFILNMLPQEDNKSHKKEQEHASNDEP